MLNTSFNRKDKTYIKLRIGSKLCILLDRTLKCFYFKRRNYLSSKIH